MMRPFGGGITRLCPRRLASYFMDFGRPVPERIDFRNFAIHSLQTLPNVRILGSVATFWHHALPIETVFLTSEAAPVNSVAMREYL